MCEGRSKSVAFSCFLSSADYFILPQLEEERERKEGWGDGGRDGGAFSLCFTYQSRLGLQHVQNEWGVLFYLANRGRTHDERTRARCKARKA